MKSSKERGIGAQKPQIRLEPAYEYTDGDDAADLCAAYGYALDPWQKNIIRCWLGRDKDDKFTSKSCGLSVPRQNGKNALLEVRELYGLSMMGEKILHTAQEVKTAREAFLRLCGFFENDDYPELKDLVVSIRKANGQEAIKLKNGGSIQFTTRSSTLGRGFSVDTVMFDEAQSLTDAQMNALLPVLSAAPSGNRQFIYTGTPPDDNAPGVVFYRVRKSAIKKEDPTLAWHEWSVEKPIDNSAEWKDVQPKVLDTNPACGYRIDLSAIEKEFYNLSREGFSRERLGWWNDATASSAAIDEDRWNACQIAITNVPEAGKTAIGIKFSPSGGEYALAWARVPKEGAAYVELDSYDNTYGGMSNITKWILTNKEKIAYVVIDGKNGATTLRDDLFAKGFSKNAVHVCNTANVIAAATRIISEVSAKSVQHIKSDALDISATKSIKRKIGSDGGIGFGDSVETSSLPIEAASLALWGARTTKRNPGRKMRVL